MGWRGCWRTENTTERPRISGGDDDEGDDHSDDDDEDHDDSDDDWWWWWLKNQTKIMRLLCKNQRWVDWKSSFSFSAILMKYLMGNLKRWDSANICPRFPPILTVLAILWFCDERWNFYFDIDRWKSKDGTLGEKNKGHYLIFQAQPFHQLHQQNCHYNQQFKCHFYPYHHNYHHHHYWPRPHFPSTICFVEKHIKLPNCTKGGG